MSKLHLTPLLLLTQILLSYLLISLPEIVVAVVVENIGPPFKCTVKKSGKTPEGIKGLKDILYKWIVDNVPAPDIETNSGVNLT